MVFVAVKGSGCAVESKTAAQTKPWLCRLLFAASQNYTHQTPLRATKPPAKEKGTFALCSRCKKQQVLPV